MWSVERDREDKPIRLWWGGEKNGKEKEGKKKDVKETDKGDVKAQTEEAESGEQGKIEGDYFEESDTGEKDGAA